MSERPPRYAGVSFRRAVAVSLSRDRNGNLVATASATGWTGGRRDRDYITVRHQAGALVVDLAARRDDSPRDSYHERVAVAAARAWIERANVRLDACVDWRGDRPRAPRVVMVAWHRIRSAGDSHQLVAVVEAEADTE